MAVKTLATLRAEATQIANETGKRLNTATRVGNALLDIVDSTPAVGIDPRAAPYNAAGNGVANDSAALALAIAAGVAAGKPVCGNGATYGVSGDLTLIAGAWLQDISLKQLTPSAGGDVRTLHSNGASGIRLVRVTVNRNGTGAGGGLADAAGIWIEGGSGHYFEDVEVYGDDMGTGFAVFTASNFDVVRLHAHDIRYLLASDPGDDRVQGFWFNGCSDFRVLDPKVHDLGGNYGSGPTPRYSRSAFNTCDNFDLVNAQVWNVDQGIDVTGSDGNTNFRILGGCVRDCNIWGWKFANSAKGGTITGAVAERCGASGFEVQGPAASSAVMTSDLTFVNCVAYDTGSNGQTVVSERIGFRVDDGLTTAAGTTLGIRFIGCKAYDRQSVPTMQYGFVNSTPRPADGLRLNQCIDCDSVGHETAPYFGVHSATDVSWQANAQFPTRSKIASLEWIEHFTAVAAVRGMVAAASGVAASFSDEPNDSNGRIGIGNCRTGTDTTGSAGILTRSDMMRFGGGRHRLRWDVNVPALSDGTDTFTARVGFLDSITAEPTDGAYFRYTHSVNGGEWQAVTRAAGVETAADTNVAASTAWVYFEIEINADGTEARFHINGVRVVTSTTNIPTGANLTGIGAALIKSAGVNNRELRLDMMAYSFEPSTLL